MGSQVWCATRDTPGLYNQRDLAPQPGCQEGHSYSPGVSLATLAQPLANVLAPLRGAYNAPMMLRKTKRAPAMPTPFLFCNGVTLFRVWSSTRDRAAQAEEQPRAVLQDEVSADGFVRSFLCLIPLDGEFRSDFDGVLCNAETD